MNRQVSEKKNSVSIIPEFVQKLVVRTVFFVLTILVFLSLVSHNPEDTHILAGGLPDYATVSNWIGLFGAHISRWLILWLGFASYIGVVMVFVCVISRVFSKQMKPVNKVYVAGIFLFIWGCAMLLGNFPEFLLPTSQRLNMAQTPGGVIGQRFCSPWSPGQTGGWLAYVVNQTGSIIISISMITIGVVTIWHFDWHDRMKGWLTILINWEKNRSAKKETNVDLKSKVEKSLRRKKNSMLTTDPDSKATEDRNPPHKNDSVDPIESANLPLNKDGDMALRSKTKNSVIPYKFPSLDLLSRSSSKSSGINPKEIEVKKEILQDTLDSFSIDAAVGDTTAGPRVTLFEIRPAPGVKVERISSLANNISMNLKAESLRILTPIPGKDTVGIEVPNRVSSSVSIRDLLESPSWGKNQASLPLALGKDISGKPVILDLAKAPHLLIAGATGSGKSVCMNTLILSLLYRFSLRNLN